ncbi:14105_t:CDS:2 [Funneliformis caledonium]|uniref:14105_t:CDS:1 n=1 Tax=Funneliformis caledonium TaxID=1117310 RepID=A0A9N9ALA6_9GLOM|nr:14105_t:CDS:2 [Funneliformis caledonium]
MQQVKSEQSMKDYWEKMIIEQKEKLRSQGFNEDVSKEEGESSTKKVSRKRKSVNYNEDQIHLPKRKSTKSVNNIDDDNKITDEQIAHFDRIFHDLDPEKM